jgi:ribosome-associated protein
MIQVTRTFAIPERDIYEKFIMSSGPGGQNVNKVATAVQLRFDIDQATSLPQSVKERLKKLAQNQITQENVLIIESSQHRSQERNRKAAREKLAKLVCQALHPPKNRKKTHPTKAANEMRLERKKLKSHQKQLRKSPPLPDRDR